MGIAYNTSIVMDGLVSYMDVSNLKCYPGSGSNITDLINFTVSTGASSIQISAIGASFGANKNTYIYTSSKIPNTGYTKCCWFNLDDVTTYQPLICGTLSTRHCMWMNKTAYLTASHSNSAAFGFPVFTSIAGTTALSTGIWYFGAVTYSNTSGFNIYLNNRRDQTSVTTQTFGDASNDNYFGYYGDPFTSPITPTLNGIMGPMMYYNRVLSAAEIKTNYNAMKKRYGL